MSPLIRIFLIVILLCVFSARLKISFAQDTVQTHVVQAGEYLSAIASRYGISSSALIRANGISNPDVLRIGQVLVIPSGGTGAITAPPTKYTCATDRGNIPGQHTVSSISSAGAI